MSIYMVDVKVKSGSVDYKIPVKIITRELLPEDQAVSHKTHPETEITRNTAHSIPILH